MPSPLPSRHFVLNIQLIFNIGFYALIPFLAVHMSTNLQLAGWMIGLVLGVRTFSQQGLFIIGALLAERFGCRPLMLTGCCVRIAGYLVFAWSGGFWGMLLGAFLTGMGGAMFSPCLEALTAEISANDKSALAQKNTTRLFALFAVYGELGAVSGPLLGVLLWDIGFQHMALCSAALFMLALLLLHLNIPHQTSRIASMSGWQRLLANRPFLWFTLFYSSYLLSYNQVYFGLPKELQRSLGSIDALAWLFVIASLLVIVLQLPIARLTRHWPPQRTLVLGFLLLALAFVFPALRHELPGAWWQDTWLPYAGLILLLMLGQMCVQPLALSLVPHFAAYRQLPLHYGALASVAGCIVLVSNVWLGWLFDLDSSGRLFWQASAAFPLASALFFLLGGKRLFRQDHQCK